MSCLCEKIYAGNRKDKCSDFTPDQFEQIVYCEYLRWGQSGSNLAAHSDPASKMIGGSQFHL